MRLVACVVLGLAIACQAKSHKSIHRISNDIEKLEERIDEFPAGVRSQIASNLHAIRRDATTLAGHVSKEQKARLQKATQMRLEALHEQVSEATGKYEKVAGDVSALLGQVKTASLSPSTKKGVVANLKSIENDVSEMKSASGEHRARLSRAVHLRMQALEEQLATKPATHEDKVEKVVQDTAHLEQLVASARLPAADRSSALDDIRHISMDAKSLSGAKGAKRDHLKKALDLRLEALHEILGSAAPTNHVAHAAPTNHVAQVALDTKQLEQAVAASNLPKGDREKAISDLRQISRDAKLFSSASGSKKAALKKALDLRLEALHEFIGPDHQAADEVVLKDIHALEEKTNAMDLSHDRRSAVMDNLAAMKKDAHMVATASKGEKARFSRALNLRMKALHAMLDDTAEPMADSQVVHDIALIKDKISATNLPTKMQSNILDNLGSLEEDVDRASTAGHREKERLQKAIGLRMQALRAQLKNADNVVDEMLEEDYDEPALEEESGESDDLALEEDEFDEDVDEGELEEDADEGELEEDDEGELEEDADEGELEENDDVYEDEDQF